MNTTDNNFNFSIGNFKEPFGAIVILIIIIGVSCWCSLYVILGIVYVSKYIYYKCCSLIRKLKRRLTVEQKRLLIIIYEILFGSVINTRNISYLLEN